MGTPLADALRSVDLQPGRTYREQINGHTVEVRVLDATATSELFAQIMLEPWVDLPFTPALTIRPKSGSLPLPDPPDIPAEEAPNHP